MFLEPDEATVCTSTAQPGARGDWWHVVSGTVVPSHRNECQPNMLSIGNTYIGYPNKSARFKVLAIIVLLGWRL